MYGRYVHFSVAAAGLLSNLFLSPSFARNCITGPFLPVSG